MWWPLTADLLKNVEHLAGVSFQEMMEKSKTAEGKKEVLKEIAKNIGTKATSLEQRLLPDLLNINLNN